MATENFYRQIFDGIRWGRFSHQLPNTPDKARTMWGLHPEYGNERYVPGGELSPDAYARFHLLPYYLNQTGKDRENKAISDPREKNGNFFTGVEIRSNQFFAAPAKGGRVEFEARLRLSIPSGCVAAFYAYTDEPPGTGNDELDFEFVGKQMLPKNGKRLWLVTWNDGPPPNEEHPSAPTGWQWGQWNNYRIVWRSNKVAFEIKAQNSNRYQNVRTTTRRIPDEKLRIQLNIWAPLGFGKDAFEPAHDPAFRPVNARTGKESWWRNPKNWDRVARQTNWWMDVDWVEVRRFNSKGGEIPVSWPNDPWERN